MDTSTALIAHLDRLLNSVDLRRDLLTSPLTALTWHLRQVVSSYLGLQLVIDDLGQQVTLTAFEPGVKAEDVATSVRLPLLRRPGTQPASGITFYARSPGALVDLAADWTFALRGRDPGTAVVAHTGLDRRWGEASLDDSLTPTSLLSGITGVSELATINRAIGRLLSDGYEQAEGEFLRRATAAGTSTHTYAARLLGDRERGDAAS